MRIVVTGGAGYIGSHTVLTLLGAGHDVVVLDNLSNSSLVAIDRVAQISGAKVDLRVLDLLDEAGVTAVVREISPDAVMHFAGLKAVGESVQQPERYYRTNLAGTLNLVRAMDAADVRTLVFSSSATVYGDPPSVPIREDFPLSATNPYGWSKLMVEQVLRDLHASDGRWRIGVLRYFNPVGAHPSGLIGEDPQGVPNNLFPYITQVATGRLEKLTVHGGDYPTPDGTGVRDYIHVLDLAAGHLAALDALTARGGCHQWNLGTGRGYSVMEAVRTFTRVNGRDVPYEIGPRRPGDIAAAYADPSRAEAELGWRSRLDLERMCADAWRWQSQNPSGYRG